MDTQGKGPSFNPRPITGKVTADSEFIFQQMVTVEVGNRDLCSGHELIVSRLGEMG